MNFDCLDRELCCFEVRINRNQYTESSNAVIPMAPGDLFGILCQWGNESVTLSMIRNPSLSNRIIFEKIEVFSTMERTLLVSCSDLRLSIRTPTTDIIVKVQYSISTDEIPPQRISFSPVLMDKFQASIVKHQGGMESDSQSIEVSIFNQLSLMGTVKEIQGVRPSTRTNVGQLFEAAGLNQNEHCLCTITQTEEGEMISGIYLSGNTVDLAANQTDTRIYKLRKNDLTDAYVSIIPVIYRTLTDTLLFVTTLQNKMTVTELYNIMSRLKGTRRNVQVSLRGLKATVALSQYARGTVVQFLNRVVVFPHALTSATKENECWFMKETVPELSIIVDEIVEGGEPSV